MKKKYIILIFFSVFLCLLIIKNNVTKDISTFSVNYLNQYKAVQFPKEDIDLSQPKGITAINKGIVVVDSGNNRLIFLDDDGNYIKSIGNIGNGPLEFLDPTGITIDKNNNIYVIDNGNRRIQILNENGDYLDSIMLREFSKMRKESYLSDIAVDEKNRIYFSTCCLEQEFAHIYSIDTNNKIEKIGSNKYGYLISGSSNIFFSQQLELKYEDNKIIAQSGKNSFYKIKDSKLIKEYKLPTKYAPRDGFVADNYIYVISGAFYNIDKFDLSGKYIGTLLKGGRDYLGLKYIVVKENIIYATNPEKNLIYKLDKIK